MGTCWAIFVMVLVFLSTLTPSLVFFIPFPVGVSRVSWLCCIVLYVVNQGCLTYIYPDSALAASLGALLATGLEICFWSGHMPVGVVANHSRGEGLRSSVG